MNGVAQRLHGGTLYFTEGCVRARVIGGLLVDLGKHTLEKTRRIADEYNMRLVTVADSSGFGAEQAGRVRSSRAALEHKPLSDNTR